MKGLDKGALVSPYNLEKRPMKEKSRQGHALNCLSKLYAFYPKAAIALHFTNPLELLIATMLSAQSTDMTVNKVTISLFAKYRTCADYIKAPKEELEKDIYSTGFYHNKAKNIKQTCSMIERDFGGLVPKTMENLLKLPGVARKTANIVLANAYGVVKGIPVDTHVKRLANRLGFSKETKPDKIERDLMLLVPPGDWFRVSYTLIEHGRACCQAKKPRCGQCVLANDCPFYLGIIG